MSKVFLSLCLVLFFTLPLFAQSVDTAWVRIYSGSGIGNDWVYGMAVDSSGNIYVTGQSLGNGTDYDCATIKYDSKGNTLWERRYNGSVNSEDGAYDLTIDRFGNIYVAGVSVGSGTFYDYLTIKYYPNGDTAWVRRYNGSGNSDDGVNAITVDDSGNVYVTGYSEGDGTFGDYVTIKYYFNGDTAWIRRYDGPANFGDGAFAIAVDDSGNVYATGGTYVNAISSDYATVKYYPNGDTAWIRRYNGPENGLDVAFDIALDTVGNIYVTGYSEGNGTSGNYVTIQYNPSGDTGWVRRYEGSGNYDDRVSAIVVDDSGYIYVTGKSYGDGTDYDYATIKYRPNGDTAWLRRYNGTGNYSDNANSITVECSGNVYVSGVSYSGLETDYDYATIKYYPNGDIAWVRKYNGPANSSDYASKINVDKSGNVYVSGQIYDNGTIYDYATIKYVQFLRGDANRDSKVSLADIVYLINYLFKFGPTPEPNQSGDANCDGKVSLGDIVYLINYLFKFGPAPCI